VHPVDSLTDAIRHPNGALRAPSPKLWHNFSQCWASLHVAAARFPYLVNRVQPAAIINLGKKIVMKNTIKSQSTIIPSVIAATLVAFVCIAGAGSAQAAEPSQPLTKTVTYGDLNLDTESGAKVLYVRLRNAAKDVCSPYESKELSRKRVWTVCVSSALASAAEQINKPMVTALIAPSINGITG
jgi:UrcA family protein